jgi:hypothetical protein
MTPARLRWGLTLILVGVVLLLVNMGRIFPIHSSDVAHLLPWVLIGIGIEKIFTSTKLEFLSYFAVLATVGIVGYSIYEGTPDLLTEGAPLHRSNVVDFDPAVTLIDASIILSDAELDVRSTSVELFRAQKPVNWGYSSFSHSLSSDKLTVDLDAERRSGVRIDIDLDNPSWEIAIAENPQSSLIFDLNQVDAHLNFAEMHVTKLDIQATDCELYVKIGEKAADCQVELYGESNKVKLRLPSSSGVRIRGYDDDSYFEALGMIRTGGAYVNTDYETSTNKIDIVLDESLNSLNIDFY